MSRTAPLALLALAIASLAGCAGAPVYLAAPSAPAGHALAAEGLTDHQVHTVSYLDLTRHTQYLQNFGGGGVGVGLMLGPLGVLANAKAIESNTAADTAALFGKFEVAAVAELRAVAEAAGFALDGGAAADRITPYLLVVRTEGEQLCFGSALLVQRAGAAPWRGVYLRQLGFTVAKAEAEKGLADAARAALQREARAGFAVALDLYRADLAGALVAQGEVRFQSDFVSPRFRFELLGQRLPTHDGSLVVRTYDAVYSLPPGAVTVKPGA